MDESLPTRGLRLCLRLASVILFFILQSAMVQAGEKPPHILFIVVDDLRPQLNVYGHPEMITPNIDALAGRGVVFDRAFANYPVCGASRASVLTGLRPTATRFTNYNSWASKDAPDAIALNSWLQQHGYQTTANGKIFHHGGDQQKGWSSKYNPKGFMQYRHHKVTKYKGIYANVNARKWAWQAQDVEDDVLQGGKVALAVERQIKEAAASDKPWFITMGLTKPHLPFISPTRYWDMYEHDKIDLASNPFAPSGVPEQAMHNSGELRNMYALIPAEGGLPDDISRYLIHGYYAAVSYSDAMIGRALQALERQGIADETIVILWGDHGFQLGEHGLWVKHSTFDTSLRVPLIVSVPGLTPAGKRSGAIVELVDLFPTICDLAGIPHPPEQLEGDSFKALLGNPALPGKNAGFARYQNGDAMITSSGIYTRFANGQAMYYDHVKDPAENTNVVNEPAYADLVKALDLSLSAQLERYSPH